MNTYLVGGAIRDALLGVPVLDRDWVVVGATAADMLARGFVQVGRDFPVFLDPDSGEEHALARTERKVGAGHTGFQVFAEASVTLEQDLERRDLTINAMARSETGEIIDPFGGRRDLEQRVLRHVSAAFSEDPLRVFRVARFAARFDFDVAPETRTLMRAMAERGDLEELAAERVWQEFEKALETPAPNRFAQVLAETRALDPWVPELAPPARIRDDVQGALLRYASIALTLAPAPVDALSSRLKAPSAFARLALVIARFGRVLGEWPAQPAGEVLAALRGAGLLRRESDVGSVQRVLELDHAPGAFADVVRSLQTVGADAVADAKKPLQGAALGQAIDAARLKLLAQAQRAEHRDHRD